MDLVSIINLPVYTQSSNYLGRIIDVEINPESNQIEKFLIKSHNPFKNLFQGRLIVDANQVVSISGDKMIVKDNLKEIKELASDLAR